MRYEKHVVVALLFIGVSSPILAQGDLDTLRRAQEQIRQALKDPEKVKIMECMGLKVYEDPQPAGHPPSPSECQRIMQTIENEYQKQKSESAETFYRSRFLLAGLLLRAGYVCDADSKQMINVSAALIAGSEFKTLSKAYPDTTKRWMEEGAQNFNGLTMKSGIREACRFASDTRRKADAVVRAD